MSDATKNPSKVLVNAPIDFELKTLDPNHPHLKVRGFTKETIRHFGLGFCNRGMLNGRITIPLHDPQGRLVGYAGMLTKDAEISETNPKYRFPEDRGKDDVKLEFRKTLVLYNAHRIKKPVDQLFVVENISATWWLHQHGFRNVVSVMGANCSFEQGAIIISMMITDGTALIVADGDDEGERFAYSFLAAIATKRKARWIKCDGNKQPTDYDGKQLSAFLERIIAD